MFATHKFTCTVSDAISKAVRESFNEELTSGVVSKPKAFYTACSYATQSQSKDVEIFVKSLKNLIEVGERVARESAGDIGVAIYREHTFDLVQELGQ